MRSTLLRSLAAALLLAIPGAAAEAGDLRFDGPCSAVPGTTVELRIVATLDPPLTAGGYQGEVRYDPALLELLSYEPPVAGAFDAATSSRLISPGDLLAAGIACASAPAPGAFTLAKVRFRVIGSPGSAAHLSMIASSLLTPAGAPIALTPAAATLAIVANPDRDCDGVPDAVDDCPSVYDPAQADGDLDGRGDACDPTQASVASFTAQVAGGAIVLSWTTAAEPGFAGFRLSRSMTPGGPWEELGNGMIAARGGASTGAAYSYRDRPPAHASDVFYHLTLVATSGATMEVASIQVVLDRNREPDVRVRIPESKDPGAKRPRRGGRP